MSDLDQMDPAKFYDATLRFTVASGRDPHVHYMVALDSYAGNGECDCPNFVFPPRGQSHSKHELCANCVTADEAVRRGWVPLPKSGRISDALRCKHIVDARDQLATAVVKTLAYAEKHRK